MSEQERCPTCKAERGMRMVGGRWGELGCRDPFHSSHPPPSPGERPCVNRPCSYRAEAEVEIERLSDRLREVEGERGEQINAIRRELRWAEIHDPQRAPSIRAALALALAQTEAEGRIERALAVPDNEYHKQRDQIQGDITYVTPRDPRRVLAETRSALISPAQPQEPG